MNCRKEGVEPEAGSYALSEKNNIYHGVPFSVSRCIHGEENAIAAMVTEEGQNTRLKIIPIVGSPKDTIMPCGMCREAIYRFGVKNAIILCANLSLSKIEIYDSRALPKILPRRFQ